MPVDQRREVAPDHGTAAPGAPAQRYSGQGTAGSSRDTAPSTAPDHWSTAWIVVIVLLALAATAVVAVGLADPVRQLIVIPFVLVAPGVAVARLARLESRTAEVAVGVLLSLGIAGLVAGVLLAVGRWDPTLAVVILAIVTFVALELDPRIPSRAVVWRGLWSAAQDGRGGPVHASVPLSPSARPAEPLPPPPVAVVRRGPRRAPVAIQPAKSGGKRQAFGEDPLDAPAISRHLRSTIDGVIDDLAARKDARSR